MRRHVPRSSAPLAGSDHRRDLFAGVLLPPVHGGNVRKGRPGQRLVIGVAQIASVVCQRGGWPGGRHRLRQQDNNACHNRNRRLHAAMMMVAARGRVDGCQWSDASRGVSSASESPLVRSLESRVRAIILRKPRTDLRLVQLGSLRRGDVNGAIALPMT